MIEKMHHIFSKKQKSQSGQIGLIVILTMVVILTIGLSVASRSSQEVEITSQEENSTRVFNAAESGIEEALSSILTAEEAGDTSGLTGSTTNADGIDRKYSVAISDSLETHLNEGVTAEIKLNSAQTPGTLNIKWSRENCSNTPAALLISVFYDDGTTIAKQYGVNINNCDLGNNFAYNPIASTSSYYGDYNLNIEANGQFLRVKPLYNATDIFIESTSLVDEAQYNIDAQAQNTADSKETSAISARRTLPTAPGVMDYALVSGANIVKN